MMRGLLLFVVALIFGLVLDATWAQQPTKMPIVGVLVASIASDDPLINVMRDSLREQGYVEGRNIRIEFRGAQGKLDRLPARAEELVRLARTQIATTAIEAGLPMVAGGNPFTEAGGLMSCGGEAGGACRRVAYFVDRLVKGAKPSDLPVEQSVIFKLVVNMRTAKVLDIKIQSSILLLADEVMK